MTDYDTSAADPVPALVGGGPPREVRLPRCLALASPRDADDPYGLSVVRLVPRERLVARRVYAALDDGWAVYVGSSSDEMRRIHEHEERLRREVPDIGELTWVWFPAPVDPYGAEEGLVRLLAPTAQRVRRGKDGRPLPPTAGQLAALRAAGIKV